MSSQFIRSSTQHNAFHVRTSDPEMQINQSATVLLRSDRVLLHYLTEWFQWIELQGAYVTNSRLGAFIPLR